MFFIKWFFYILFSIYLSGCASHNKINDINFFSDKNELEIFNKPIFISIGTLNENGRYSHNLCFISKIQCNNILTHKDILFLVQDGEPFLVDRRLVTRFIAGNKSIEDSEDVFLYYFGRIPSGYGIENRSLHSEKYYDSMKSKGLIYDYKSFNKEKNMLQDFIYGKKIQSISFFEYNGSEENDNYYDMNLESYHNCNIRYYFEDSNSICKEELSILSAFLIDHVSRKDDFFNYMLQNSYRIYDDPYNKNYKISSDFFNIYSVYSNKAILLKLNYDAKRSVSVENISFVLNDGDVIIINKADGLYNLDTLDGVMLEVFNEKLVNSILEQNIDEVYFNLSGGGKIKYNSNNINEIYKSFDIFSTLKAEPQSEAGRKVFSFYNTFKEIINK